MLRMENKMNFEPVLVRVFKSGDQDVKKYGLKEVHITDMIMIFPCESADTAGKCCNSYEYTGQHSGCAYHLAIMPNTRPATKEESKRMV